MTSYKQSNHNNVPSIDRKYDGSMYIYAIHVSVDLWYLLVSIKKYKDISTLCKLASQKIIVQQINWFRDIKIFANN